MYLLCLVLGLWGFLAEPMVLARDIHSNQKVAKRVGEEVKKLPDYKIALILDLGGKDDQSFNTSAYQGLEVLKKELTEERQKDPHLKPLLTSFVEPIRASTFESSLRKYVNEAYDLIICIGHAQVEPLKKMAEKHPNIKFAIIDAKVDLPNVASITFADHEGSFIVGALAAMHAKGAKVGFIGGMDIPLLRRFELGYSAGARYVTTAVTVVTHFVDITHDGWKSPSKAKQIAQNQFKSGVDVIYAVAAGSNIGIFDAAVDAKKLAIGVDMNQNYLRPGFILTSMIKNIQGAVVKVGKDAFYEKFKAGEEVFSLKNEGISYVIDEHNKALIDDTMKKKLEEIRAQIIEGKIIVPDYFKPLAPKSKSESVSVVNKK